MKDTDAPQDQPLDQVFGSIFEKQQQGVLVVSARGRQRRLLFREGSVSLLDPFVGGRRRLGEILVSAGLVRQKDVEEALKEQKRSLRFLGEILVSKGRLTKEDLHRILELQVREELHDLLLSRRCAVDFREGEPVEEAPAAWACFPVPAVLKEAHRRKQEASADSGPRADLAGVYVATVDPAEWPDEEEAKVLTRLGGRRDVQSAADSLLRAPFDVARTVSRLQEKGAVREATTEELLEHAAEFLREEDRPHAITYLQLVQRMQGSKRKHDERLATLFREAGDRRTSAQICLRLARKAASDDRLDEARRHLNQSLEDWPTSTEALSASVDLARARGDRKSEVSGLKKLAQLKSRGSDQEQAIQSLERALELEPDDLVVRRHLIDLRVETGAKEQAMEELEGEIELVKRMGRPAELSLSYERMLALDPSRGDVRRSLTRLHKSRSTRFKLLMMVALVLLLIGAGFGWFAWRAHRLQEGRDQVTTAKQLIENGKLKQAGAILDQLLDDYDAADVAGPASRLREKLDRLEIEYDRMDHAAVTEALDGKLDVIQSEADAGDYATALQELQDLKRITRGEDLTYRVRLKMRLICQDYVRRATHIGERYRDLDASVASSQELEALLDSVQSSLEWESQGRVEDLRAAVVDLVERVDDETRSWLNDVLVATELHERNLQQMQELATSLQAQLLHVQKLDSISDQYVEAKTSLREGRLEQALTLYRGTRNAYGDGELRTDLDTVIDRIESLLAQLDQLAQEVKSGDLTQAHAHALETHQEAQKLCRVPLVRVPVRIESQPTGAELSIDGKVIGHTPVTLQILGGAATSIVAAMPGFHDVSKSIQPLNGPRYQVVMAREITFRTQLPGTFEAPPVAHGPHVYAASRDGILYRVRPDEDGAATFFHTQSLSGTLARPLSTPHGVVVTVYEGQVFMVRDQETRLKAAWKVELNAGLRTDPVRLGEVVLLGTEEGSIIALALADGAERWRLEHPGQRVIGPPVLDDERLYVALSGGEVKIYRIEDRELLATWKIEQELAQSPQLDRRRLVATTVAGDVIALDVDGGEIVSRVQTRDLPSAPPLLSWPTLDVPLGRRLVRIDLETERMVQAWGPEPPISGSPLRLEDSLLVCGADGSIYGLHEDSPRPWFHTQLADAPAVSGPVPLGEDRVVLLFRDGTLCITSR